jgi:hypothetical protein
MRKQRDTMSLHRIYGPFRRIVVLDTADRKKYFEAGRAMARFCFNTAPPLDETVVGDI